MTARTLSGTLAATVAGLAAGVVVGATSVSPAPAAAPQAAAGRPSLSGVLQDERVLLLVADGTSATDAAAAVLQAQGSLAGRASLRPALLGADGPATAARVVSGTTPAGLDLPGGTGLEPAGSLLAAALLGSLTGSQQARVLGGFAGAELVSVDVRTTTRPTAVLLVGGPGDRPALASLAEGLRTRVPLVLTAVLGPS